MSGNGRSRRLLALAGALAAVALVVVLVVDGGSEGNGGVGRGDESAARGGGGEERSGSGSGAAQPPAAAPERYEPQPGSAEEKAYESLTGAYEELDAAAGVRPSSRTGHCGPKCDRRLRRVDSSAFCGLLTERARRETVRYARLVSGRSEIGTCAEAMHVVLRRVVAVAGRLPPPPTVIGVNVAGDRATASVRFGDGPITSVSLVREDGEWKLPASPVGGGAS